MTAAAEWPEAVRAEAHALPPKVVTGEVNVLPAKRGEVGEQRVRHRLAAVAQCVECAAEVDRVPRRDGGGDDGEATGVCLRVRDGVDDFR